jgi:vacuolar-type H+-ATPase subunit I/STV1
MIVGLILSAIIPFISSLLNGELSIEVLAEVISAVMMTFVESLSSFFSFLRIGAYGLAHGSLSIAANSFSISTSPVFGLLLTNLIALSFEFISCTVQSTRLLYHEFMGKFYTGGGTEFKPFHLKARTQSLNLISEDKQPILQPIEIIKSGIH